MRALPPLAWLPGLAWALFGTAWAQTLPRYGSGDALKGVQAPLAAPEPRPPAPSPPLPPAPEAPARAGTGTETLKVADIVLEGAAGIAEGDWRAAVAPYVGREMTMAEVEALARTLTAWLRARGLLLARVFAPPQDARDGRLRFTVVPGRLERVSLRNASRVDDEVVRRSFSPLLREPVLTRAGLERAMLQVGDLPGATPPRLTLAPGSEPGWTDMQVDLEAAAAGGGQVLYDNWGSRYSGRDRLGAQGHLDSPFGRGDQITLSGMTTQGGGLLNGRLAYATPVGSSGLGSEIAWSKTTYDLGGDYAALGATGEARSLEARWSYPLLRSSDQRLVVQGGLARRHLHDRVETGGLDTAKRSTSATLGLHYDGPAAQAGAVLTWGHLTLADAAQRAENEAGVDSVGTYARLNVDVGRQWRWAGGWQLAATLALQQALVHRNLDASEQMAISGTGGVKAYREAVNGDDGLLATLRLQRELPAWRTWSQALGAFVEWGRVRPERDWSGAAAGTRLADAGLGYELRAGSLFAHLDVARTVGPRPETAEADPGRWRALLQAGWIF